MKNEPVLSDSPEQPWWYVRSQLIVALAALTAICMSLWVDSPVRHWVTKSVIQAELPTVRLVALNEN